MIIIGELINASGKKVREAIAGRDGGFIREIARRQEEAGAHYIDVNVAVDSGDPSRETKDMEWAVSEVMQAVKIPLSIDTTNTAALHAGLRLAGKGTFINSITAEEARLEPFLELAVEFDSPCVALPIRDGIPPTAEERLKICSELTERAAAAGVAPRKALFRPFDFTGRGKRRRRKHCPSDPGRRQKNGRRKNHHGFEQYFVRPAAARPA
jgi:5-methyltetrahydrofolate corrinoid/iron sulfur protein methyltransferase